MTTKGKPIRLKRKSKPTVREGIHSIRLSNNNGTWWLYINESKHPIPATDVEVALWLKLQEAKHD